MKQAACLPQQNSSALVFAEDMQKVTQNLYNQAIQLNLLAKRGLLKTDQLAQLQKVALEIEHLVKKNRSL